MILLHLSEKELNDIYEARDNPEIGERQKTKLLAITMHHENIQHGAISKCLQISNATLVSYLKGYRDGGLSATLEDRYYRPSSSLEPFWQCLMCCFHVAPVADAKAAVARIEVMTGIKLSESQVRRTMKKMGMSLKKSAPIPGKADPQLQFEFFENELKPRLDEASQGTRKVLFVDAAHFVLGAFLGMVWCFARPFIKTSPGRQRYNILGAIDSHSKELISIRTTENINAEVVCELLRKIKIRHPECLVTLVMDNARYQHCRLVMDSAQSLGIELLFLPAYSPNLNLIERLWKLVKKRCMCNRYYPDFTCFRDAIDQCLDEVNGTLKPQVCSLLSLNFQFFQNRKT